ncbi:MAG TPA: leucyl aminopeptidase family protein [Devosiaceae bacterium]|nr:leucyl aminopeptidase family protein [Devosiaceae bacterium]
MTKSEPLPLICVEEGRLDAADLQQPQLAWAAANRFSGQRGRLLPLPGEGGSVAGYLFGLGDAVDRPLLVTGLAAAALAPGAYSLAGSFGDPTLAALGFRLGAYRYDRYRTAGEQPVLAVAEGADMAEVDRLTEAATIARDLVNTPANDLGPVAFEREIRALAARHEMQVTAIVGDDLLAQNFPMVHAVGRAAQEAPRLLDLHWGPEDAPRVTLVGKGVTFDTGGLDIKPASSMLLMKKDMGGAANVLGLAHAVMDAGLRVRLRVIIPVVENSISASSFRPGDVLPSRNGMTVEIGNTDAEGRLILADALALAVEDEPEFLLDMATLTGAARTALGPELPPLYTNDDSLAEDLTREGLAWDDPLWRMPLWPAYDSMLKSKIADVSHVSSGPFAGSVTAALFLQRFVGRVRPWVHLDIYAWAPDARAGRSYGGTDQGVRAAYAVLKQRYS